MPRKSLYMGTTMIDPQKTAGEIISELVRAGATSVNTDYKNGQISGLRWIMRMDGQDTLFDMPARVEPIMKIVGDRARATRVAWRQLLRWVQAQNAMIETGMVQAGEVYFAYAVHPATNKTLFQMAIDSKFKMLEPPKQ